MKKRILFINQAQFGHSAAHHNFCQGLKDKYSIVFVCLDHGFSKMSMRGVHCVYIPKCGKLKNFFALCSVACSLMKRLDIDLIWVVYFRFAFFLGIWSRLRFGVPSLLDVRTGDLHDNALHRNIENFLIHVTSCFFSHTMVLSESLKNLLKLHKAEVILLGADNKYFNSKDFSVFNFLYIGVLLKRNICPTVRVFARFCDSLPPEEGKRQTYTLVVRDSDEQVRLLEEEIIRSGRTDQFLVLRNKRHDEIIDVWKKCNVGIATIPPKIYFECQPATKLFEYMLNGMICIATGTYENRLVIKPENGIVINDSEEDLLQGLKCAYQKRTTYDSEGIAASVQKHLWYNILDMQLKPFIQKITE